MGFAAIQDAGWAEGKEERKVTIFNFVSLDSRRPKALFVQPPDLWGTCSLKKGDKDGVGVKQTRRAFYLQTNNKKGDFLCSGQ
jgi:hypothetical protein